MQFGVIVALMQISFAATWGYVVLPISGALVAVLAFYCIVEFAAHCMIVGGIYKPRPSGMCPCVSTR
jgi:hypothetical protein